jgi:hypothetical protein
MILQAITGSSTLPHNACPASLKRWRDFARTSHSSRNFPRSRRRPDGHRQLHSVAGVDLAVGRGHRRIRPDESGESQYHHHDRSENHQEPSQPRTGPHLHRTVRAGCSDEHRRLLQHTATASMRFSNGGLLAFYKHRHPLAAARQPASRMRQLRLRRAPQPVRIRRLRDSLRLMPLAAHEGARRLASLRDRLPYRAIE